MKSDPLRTAALFFETGMIDKETFHECTEAYNENSASLMELLNQDVSVKSIRNLMAMPIPLPGFSNGAKSPAVDARKGSNLHEMLSQPFYLTNQEIKDILKSWKPSVATLLERVGQVAEVDEEVRKIARGGDKTKVYNQLVDSGFLDPKTVNHAVAGAQGWKKANRLLLALNLLQYNDVLDEDVCNETLRSYQAEGDEAIPLINEEVAAFIASKPELPEVQVEDEKVPEVLLERLPDSFVRQNLFLPYRRKTEPVDRLEVVTNDPFYVELTDTLAFLTDLPVTAWYAPTEKISARVRQIYHVPEEVVPEEDSPAAPARGSRAMYTTDSVTRKAENEVDSHSAVELVSQIIEGGVEHRATDIHLEPTDQGMQVRYRIDGRLRKIMDLTPAQVQPVSSRIKVLGNLDVTERRRPQDGHFSLALEQGAFDFRVSTLPTHIGEKTVIRILDESRVMLTLEELGMPKKQNELVQQWIHRPHGLLLVTGPTGSGKTSTLYASLNSVNAEEKNVVTIEDPVEYRLKGINQVNTDANFGVTFAEGLRSILRQDPDIIMVGEIRDPETARIAMRAALTGHMVFSTLHTNTAAGAIATLANMGIEAYMLTSAITGIINQRLVRMLCAECKKSFTPKKALLEQLNLNVKSRKRMYQAVGCENCFQTGYKGRTGVYEIMPMTDELTEGIIAHKSESELVRIMRDTGYDSLLDVAIEKIYEAETSPDEVLETILAEK